MERHTLLEQYWEAVATQNEKTLGSFFTENGKIQWQNTNESFSVSEYIRANCEYPGNWKAEIKTVEVISEARYVTTTVVESTEEPLAFYVVSFFQFVDNKICKLDEYWGENSEPPQWRKDKHIGSAIEK